MGINLNKGGSINLAKEMNISAKATMGLGWVGKRGTVDLDSTVHTFDADGDLVQFVYFSRKNSTGIKHHGDDLTGGGRAEDPNEIIDITLTDLPSKVKTVYISLGIYSGAANLNAVYNSFVNITQSRKEIVRYNVEEGYGKAKSLIVGKFTRNASGDAWKFTALGTGIKKGMQGHLMKIKRESQMLESALTDSEVRANADEFREEAQSNGLFSRISRWLS